MIFPKNGWFIGVMPLKGYMKIICYIHIEMHMHIHLHGGVLKWFYGGSPSYHPFIDRDFPWNKPSTSSYWGTPIDGNPSPFLSPPWPTSPPPAPGETPGRQHSATEPHRDVAELVLDIEVKKHQNHWILGLQKPYSYSSVLLASFQGYIFGI